MPPDCGICNTKFYLLPCQIGRGRGKYCSRECATKAMQHGTELFCAWCDSSFYRQISEQDLGEKVHQFCSRECYAEWRAHKSHSYPKIGARHAHRVVAESILKRPLASSEIVHHGDLNKQNNAPRNLYVFPDQGIHSRCHWGLIPAAELAQYELLRLAQ